VTDVTVEKTIARPRAQVAAYVEDWRNDTRWIGALREARQVTDGPFGVGTRIARVASFVGRRVEYVNEIVEYEPEHRLLMRSVQAPFPMTVEYAFSDADGGTRVRIRATGDASGFYRLAERLLSFAVRRGISRDLKRLDREFE
jgi:uncharacterized protein YndB with AHSA1/START domain